jgi:hypothetical protein
MAFRPALVVGLAGRKRCFALFQLDFLRSLGSFRGRTPPRLYALRARYHDDGKRPLVKLKTYTRDQNEGSDPVVLFASSHFRLKTGNDVRRVATAAIQCEACIACSQSQITLGSSFRLYLVTFASKPETMFGE